VDAPLNAETSPNVVEEIMAIRMSSATARITPLIEAVFRNVEASGLQVAPAPEEVAADIDALQEGFRLQRIRRFYRQRHWAPESAEADFADRAEPGLKLENVAAHSWHVADAAHLLAGHFPDLDMSRIVLLAVIHDKLEIYTGDYDPVGSEGNGSGTHAFDEAARRGKQLAEYEAAHRYLLKLRPTVREWQRALLEEAIEGTSLESRFVKAIDKLQALAYVMEKKRGQLDDSHLAFTVMYSRKALLEFPRIRFHYAELLGRFLDGVAVARGISRDDLDRQVFGQLELRL
jgi:5'-deoxynucleotidase YfbR-like HD superfamily hydrolase